MPRSLRLDSTTHSVRTWFPKSRVLFYRSQRKSETQLLPLHSAALLLMAVLLPESWNTTELMILKAAADETLQKWHA